MTSPTTRRSFLKAAAAVSGSLAIQGVNVAAEAPQRAKPAVGAEGSAGGSPVLVVSQDLSRDVSPRAPAWGYITEILERAGVFFQQIAPEGLPALARQPKSIVLLAGDLQLTSEQRDALAAFVTGGGSLIGVGGTSGLNEVFGITARRPLAEGWIQVTAQDHPITLGLRSSLHVFGGYAVTAGSATSLAGVEAGKQGARGSTILENSFGEGRAILLAPDLIFSVVHIQQGVPVLQDGTPAPDETAAIDDGALKAEDGMVLDWQRDRTAMEPDGEPVFLEPISDELREIILRSIFHAACRQGVRLPVLWYWPRALKAVGHISHDTDGNIPERAWAMLEVMNRAKIKSTWCTIYPGGYPREFYEALKEQQFEIALHYDAMSGGEETSWSKKNFLLQYNWLLKETGIETIVSNKNHYTRWENRLDYLRWCEEVGIQSDQTRGSSKKGTIGFPLGGSQPYFPLDDEGDSPRRLKVLEVNMLTQDLVVVCPAEYGKQLLDSAVRHHGVAHFLFHPNHILKPDVADTICGLVDYGRSQGLEWWKNDEICQWETLRRGVAASFDTGTAFTLRTARPLREATLMFLCPEKESQAISVDGKTVTGNKQTVYGFEFDAVTMDLEGEVRVQVG
ncbi:MAG: twin-arginine translocation signal domain-containing protein [Planctomycetaceae bacterium]|nr:twin-arginine translocation signal domain-containing protein [Planctomycetaceae bacterium]